MVRPPFGSLLQFYSKSMSLSLPNAYQCHMPGPGGGGRGFVHGGTNPLRGARGQQNVRLPTTRWKDFPHLGIPAVPLAHSLLVLTTCLQRHIFALEPAAQVVHRIQVLGACVSLTASPRWINALGLDRHSHTPSEWLWVPFKTPSEVQFPGLSYPSEVKTSNRDGGL